MSEDRYRATASAYDLFSAPYREAQLAALSEALPRFLPDAGPILDIGAGSGANTEHMLENLPSARVVALEPSPAMRALALTRIARHPEWFSRVTVRPEPFFDAPLPASIGGAVALGVIGHFDGGERRAVLAELARRLPTGAAVLVDLQDPERAERVKAYEFTAATVGDIVYRGIAEAWPIGSETMRWRMSYLTIDGDRVLTEDTVEHVYRHPAPELFHDEATDAGFDPMRIGAGTFWMLLRR